MKIFLLTFDPYRAKDKFLIEYKNKPYRNN